MTTTPACAKCGAERPIDAPEGLCPRCLVMEGMMSEVGTLAAETIDFSPSEVVADAHASTRPQTQAPVVARLFGGYRIIRPLGKGGMGTVYEAEEDASGRRLALKVLAHSLDSEQARTRFFREGRLAASVNHPNSVYIFGTEVIDDLPVITMELAAGGTLQELVKRKGPLPITEAVDAILQVIAGLEAAAAGGVLHRDVKPSNCFIDPDGTVKIGDFGLSISTLARGDASVTTTGTMLGTPAYASPEQLRGDELDARSDMYAVGVTLYFLLTGQTPFTAGNMVKLLATVLERPAESPRKLRPEIPKELANIVLRCLAKQPAQRFRNYEELRVVLLPFTFGAAEPAGLGARFLAGALDVGLAECIIMTVAIFIFPAMNHARQTNSWNRLVSIGSSYLLPFLTFVIPEGIWGATLGKAVLGLRVVGLRNRKPGLLRALARALILLLAFGCAIAVNQYLVWIIRITGNRFLALFGFAIFILSPLLLFSTARRKNGMAAIHDLLSGTRVIIKPTPQTRSGASDAAEPAATIEGTPRIGPYHVLAELDASNPGALLLGYDARVFRKVWIRRLPDDSPPVAPLQRMLGRRGRLRWLGGKRAAGDNWDAYEAPSGQPLTALLSKPQPWKKVRFWLMDLALELDAGLKDQSLPDQLGLDRVWITEDGRAKLMDFPAPGAAKSRSNGAGALLHAPMTDRMTDRDAQLLVKQVAVAALEGHAPDGTDLTNYVPAVPLPLQVRSLLSRIPGDATIQELIAESMQLKNKPAEISRTRRLVLLAGCAAPVILVGFLLTLAFILAIRVISTGFTPYPEFDEIVALKAGLMDLQSLKISQINDGTGQAIEIYIAGHFRNQVSDPTIWNEHVYKSALTPVERQMAERIVAAHPSVSDSELIAATDRVRSLGVTAEDRKAAAAQLSNIANEKGEFVTIAARMLALVWFLVVALPAMIAAVLFRGGMILHGLELAIVTQSGAPASRWRVLWRACIVWSPALALALATILSAAASEITGQWLAVTIGIVEGGAIFVLVAAAAWSLWRPERGIQDWLAGTAMVSR
jgi:hypothetical protein